MTLAVVGRQLLPRTFALKSLFYRVRLLSNVALESTSDSTDEVQFVVQQLRRKGHHVLVNPSAQSGDNSIALLLQQKVSPVDVVNLFDTCPNLMTVSQRRWKECVHFLRETSGCSAEHLPHVIAQAPEVLTRPSKDIALLTTVLMDMQIKSSALGSMVMQYPRLLALEGETCRQLVENLKGFFTAGDVSAMVQTHPDILARNFDVLESVYEYIYFNMGIEQPQFRNTVWFRRSLIFVQTRHEFLARAGLYVKPNKKKPTLSEHNPTLGAIVNTSDRQFAEGVATLTLEEFNVFKLMFKRQLERDAVDREDLDSV